MATPPAARSALATSRWASPALLSRKALKPAADADGRLSGPPCYLRRRPSRYAPQLPVIDQLLDSPALLSWPSQPARVRRPEARYRGSVLRFGSSFTNSLLLVTYGLVFTYMLPVRRPPGSEPYLLFFACGILPWTWFSLARGGRRGADRGRQPDQEVLFPAWRCSRS